MKKLTTLIFLISLFITPLISQQTLRGVVIDSESKFPLIGANVSIELETGELLGSSTDIDGLFRIKDVPLGRQRIKASYIGYKEVILDNIIFSSAKEVIINIEMEQNITTLKDLVVTARRAGEPINEMATVSAREFSVQETNRYAGSRGEPARMAANYAGVQGADDSRNDIIIRGNTPGGVLWRLDGVSIPNPNHFHTPGTNGGAVTILNNKFLDNSDFFTGAFPAEYGNAIAGVFDLKMRNGNNEKHEFSGQFGFLGTELMAEGPISKEKRSSYLAMYRYSTLKLFDFMGVNIGSDAVPAYQDAAFRVNFPGKKGANLAIFGMGGISYIDIEISDQKEPDNDIVIFGPNDRDQHFGTDLGVVGISYTKPVDINTYFKFTVSASHQNVKSKHNYVARTLLPDNTYRVDSLPEILGYNFKINRYSTYLTFNKKLSSATTLKAGFNADLYDMLFIDSMKTVTASGIPNVPATLGPWTIDWDTEKNALLLQPFVQLKHKFNDKLTGTAGITALYFSINENSFSPFEPRLGLSYRIDEKQKISAGLGLHSQTQVPYVYYYSNNTINGDPQEYNEDLGLSKSAHAILAYDRMLGSMVRMKVETYYQYLFEIPVELGNTSYSLVNSGAGFDRFFPNPLENEGTARNYGLELTIEKFFSRGYYFLFAGSVFDSKYRGSDDVLRNTSFNAKYAFNALFAKEFTFENNNSLNFGGKMSFIGGRWHGEVDREESDKISEIVYVDETVNTKQFEPYFKIDVKINYRINAKKVAHEFGIDLVNTLNRQNILSLNYAPDHPSGEAIQKEYQLGFLPIFYYKIDF